MINRRDFLFLLPAPFLLQLMPGGLFRKGLRVDLDGQKVRGGVRLEWSCRRSYMAVSKYQYRVNGGSWIDLGNINAYTVTGQSGTNDYEVRAVDGSGNASSPSNLVSVEAGEASPISIKINVGGSAERGWIADTGYTGGAIWDWGDSQIHKNANDGYGSGKVAGYFAGISSPTDFVAGTETVYRYMRYINSGTINYAITGLSPSASTLVRVHWYSDDSTISINQSISINGVTVDPLTAQAVAGIIIKEFTVLADGSGNLSINFTSPANFAGVSGIEILQPPPTPARTVFFACGDSLTDCSTLVGDTHTWPYLLADDADIDGNQGDRDPINAYPRGYDEDAAWMVRMIAQSGNQVTTQTSYIPTFVTPHDDRLWQRQIAFLMCGTNDIHTGGVSAATLQSRITTFFSTLSADITHTGIGTITKAAWNDAGMETVRQAVNTWILANSLGLDFVVDFAGDSRLDNTADTTYFNGDGVHPTAAGCAVRYELVKAALVAEGLV